MARLNSEDYQSLMAKGKVVTLKLGKRLYNQDDPINAIYFPLTCMVCLLVSANGKEPRLELAIVGKEGVVGAAEVFHPGNLTVSKYDRTRDRCRPGVRSPGGWSRRARKVL